MRHHRGNLIRLLIALIMCGVLAGTAGCTGRPAQGTAAQTISPNFVVSYAAAADRLTGLAADDGLDQVRDWALIGLAAHLGLDTTALRNSTYDTFPVRDTGFADLSRQATGPGRSLDDGKGVLHVLVPRGDPHESRTIGLLLDQHRTDAGSDAAQVQVHHYQIDTADVTVAISDGATMPTADVRSANGYVTVPVDTVAHLTDFLTRTSYLSRLELRGSRLWASGWNWPAAPGARVDIADVSVLSRGYAGSSPSARPGFSLDPRKITSAADLLAVIPGLNPDLAQRIIDNSWAGTGLSASDLDKIVEYLLFHGDQSATDLTAAGLPTDRTQLWALRSQLIGWPAYSQARYDGDLAGTAVGMTLFYTDFETKNWAAGVGTGVPTNAVAGFLPDNLAVTPWSECTPDNTKPNQSGRLWFGADPSAVDFTATSVSLGARPTQLFFRSDAANGAEVQPSYSFGRGMTWWEQHQQEVAQYEGQYQRLDDIMRWSDALDWLVTKTSATMPRLPDNEIPSNLKFADWYAHNGDLKERGPIDFVSPPSATEESVAPLPTPTFQDCGSRTIEGGVSLGDIIDREGSNSYHPTLPPPVRRAGLVEPGSAFDNAKGALDTMSDTLDAHGEVTDQLQHTFTTKGTTAEVRTTGDGRAVDQYGVTKVERSPTARRTVGVDQTAGGGQVSEHMTLDGQDLGTLAVSSYGRLVTVRWRAGPVDRARTVLESVQKRLTANPAGGIPAAGDDVLASYHAPDGRTLYDIAGQDQPFLWLTDKPPPPGDDLVLGIGEPNPDPNGAPDPNRAAAAFVSGVFVRPPPDLLAARWVKVTPAAHGQPAVESISAQPDPHSPSMRVTTSDNLHSTVYPQDGGAVAPADRVFARPEGKALLRDFDEVSLAIQAARAANDGLLRGFNLGGDGVALVGADQIFIAPPDGPWCDVVRRAIRDSNDQVPLLKLDSGQALWVNATPLGSPFRTQVLDAGQLASVPGTTIYLHEVYRNGLTVQPGPLITGSLPASARVRVRAYTVTAASSVTQAAIRNHGGGSFYRWDNPPYTNQSPATSTTPAPPPSAADSAVSPIQPPSAAGSAASRATTTILLVCPADSRDEGCQS
jgi:hypothetical protein